MNRSIMVALLISLTAVAAGAVAAPVPAPSSEEMARCAAIKPRDTRLSCYDALAHRPPDEGAPAVAEIPPAAQAPATVAAVAADPKNFGLSANQTHIADLGPKSEAAHIAILSSDQTGKTFVMLDNDQTWTVTDPDGWLAKGDAVTIRHSQFGSYLMFGPSHHSYLVRRIK